MRHLRFPSMILETRFAPCAESEKNFRNWLDISFVATASVLSLTAELGHGELRMKNSTNNSKAKPKQRCRLTTLEGATGAPPKCSNWHYPGCRQDGSVDINQTDIDHRPSVFVWESSSGYEACKRRLCTQVSHDFKKRGENLRQRKK
jgi:hypothetical protein